MKKRLRKKKHVGEFREFGFTVRATLRDQVRPAERDSFFDRWIDAVEGRGLSFGGGAAGTAFQGFVALARRGSATDEDRHAVSSFLAGDIAVETHQVDDLVDAWHSHAYSLDPLAAPADAS
jgi:uncharacterized protein YggL (DUF469 family)